MEWLAEIIEWVGANLGEILASLGSVATVIAVVYAARQFKRQSRVSQIEQEERFDQFLTVASKLNLKVGELSPEESAAVEGVIITITNKSDRPFRNLLLNIPEIAISGADIRFGSIAEPEALNMFHDSPSPSVDPRDWEEARSLGSSIPGTVSHTWSISKISQNQIVQVRIELESHDEWLTWCGTPENLWNEPVQPKRRVGLVYVDGSDTWYQEFGLPNTVVRMWPTWNPDFIVKISKRKQPRMKKLGSLGVGTQ